MPFPKIEFETRQGPVTMNGTIEISGSAAAEGSQATLYDARDRKFKGGRVGFGEGGRGKRGRSRVVWEGAVGGHGLECGCGGGRAESKPAEMKV